MASHDPARPNIVFILTDDQGCWALGCAGNTEIRTPNVDALAAHGVRCDNFFCVSPVCSPARASLLTGRIPSQHGVHDWIRGGNDRRQSAAVIEYLDGQIAYTDVLAAHGYTCGLSGKWHLGNSHRPQKSFSHWFVTARGGGAYYNPEVIRNGEVVNQPGYLTDIITDDALSFLEAQATDSHPFYLGVHYTAPHSPWLDQHPPEIVALYDQCPFDSCPQEPQHPGATYFDFQLSRMFSTARSESVPVREYLKGYFAAVTAMDLNVGRIVAKLGSLGLRDNTLVVFTSDNGFNCGHHGIWGKGSGTFPFNMYDTSVKVPAILSHPGRLPEGSVCRALLSGYDVMPTLLDYVGADHPDAGSLPGRSFVPLLVGRQAEGDERIVVFDEYGSSRMIRTEAWKYVHRYPYGPHELYDLIHDPRERLNLLAEERVLFLGQAAKREMQASLRAQLEQWFIRYVDPRLDGTHEAVTGRGQVGLVGPNGRGEQAFHEAETVAYR